MTAIIFCVSTNSYLLCFLWCTIFSIISYIYKLQSYQRVDNKPHKHTFRLISAYKLYAYIFGWFILTLRVQHKIHLNWPLNEISTTYTVTDMFSLLIAKHMSFLPWLWHFLMLHITVNITRLSSRTGVTHETETAPPYVNLLLALPRNHVS